MRAFDELRFGPGRTLNLRDSLPSEDLAVRRADGWLRQQQINGSREVLVITGRGNQSIGGVPVIRGAVQKLLYALRRQGVVASHAEHNPGAFVVQLAPIRAMIDAPRRHRDNQVEPSIPIAIAGLAPETIARLRELAERSLESLGVRPTAQQIDDEMHRHLKTLIRALGANADDESLVRGLRTALAEFD